MLGRSTGKKNLELFDLVQQQRQNWPKHIAACRYKKTTRREFLDALLDPQNGFGAVIAPSDDAEVSAGASGPDIISTAGGTCIALDHEHDRVELTDSSSCIVDGDGGPDREGDEKQAQEGSRLMRGRTPSQNLVRSRFRVADRCLF